VNNKIAGLYLNLAKALNALEEAGEDLDTIYEFTIRGTSGSVDQDVDGRWTVVQA
jgi:hypothetical protein